MDDLLIRQKIEGAIQYGYIALRQFPKSERHVLSQELRQTMWELLRLVIVCNHRYHKKTTMQDLDATLDLLRSQIRLAKDLEFLSFKKYEVWSRLKTMVRQYAKGDVSLEKIKLRIASWLGHAKHADSFRIRAKLLSHAIFRRHTCLGHTVCK